MNKTSPDTGSTSEGALCATSSFSEFAAAPVAQVLAVLQSDSSQGLSADEAARRRETYGPNEIGSADTSNALSIFIHQFQSSVVVLLIAAAVISGFMHEFLQVLGIVAAIVINALVGFITEYRAKVSLEQLARLSGPSVRTRRSGMEMELAARELVPGDIVLLEPGKRVPADLRIVDCASFSVDESALTGESVPVFKTAAAHDDHQDTTMVTHGTLALSGRAKGVVVATGLRTRLGQLGKLLASTTAGASPLEEQLDHLGSQLTKLTIWTCVVVGFLGLWHREPLNRMLETSISLAVAAIPEGLPVIATLSLAVGIRRMVRNNALVRRLSAVETLGCTTVICTDKTGTLTENRMVVVELVLPGRQLCLTGSGYKPEGDLYKKDADVHESDLRAVELLLTAGTLCNDARLENDDEEGWHVHGDPTEGALIVAARKLGISQDESKRSFPRIKELPFELERKRMSTLHKRTDGSVVLYSKGAPGVLLDLCAHYLNDGKREAMTAEQLSIFKEENKRLAAQGLRVLAIARRDLSSAPDNPDAHELEKDMEFLGLVAMYDAPKENVKDALRECREAGIRVIMLTGDQSATAQAIGGELDISSESVMSRVTPEMKLGIVKELQEQGEIVAMTGDGVNDAPALKQANIGVAMGKQGTDLARESSDLTIVDDNFATIVKAVEQGRLTYDNIQRAVAYLLTASLTSVMAITIGIVTDSGLLLLPLQLLWLNLIMHVFPGLGIVLQKGTPDLMLRRPRRKDEKLMGSFETTQIIVRSLIVSAFTMAALWYETKVSGGAPGTSVVLVTLSLSLLLQSWSWLSVKAKFRADLGMWVCTACGLFLILVAVYNPLMCHVLETQPLSLADWKIVLGASAASYVVSYLVSYLMSGKVMRKSAI